MIRRVTKVTVPAGFALMAALSMAGCQNPTDPSSTVNYNDAVTPTVSPDPIVADTNTGGKTYRVVRGNNQPDDILRYDFHSIFSATVTLNSQIAEEQLDVDFPVKITGATLVVKQATGGIITPPSGTDKEYYEYITLSASGNEFGAVGSSVTMEFETWYHLPSLRKESVVTMQFVFIDNDGTSFQRVVDFKVAP